MFDSSPFKWAEGKPCIISFIPTFITDPSILQASTGRDKQWAIAGTNVRVLESKGNTLKAAFPELVQFTPNWLASWVVSCNAYSSQERRVVSKYQQCTSGGSLDPSTVANSANRLFWVISGIISTCHDYTFRWVGELWKFVDGDCKVWKLACIYNYTCIA